MRQAKQPRRGLRLASLATGLAALLAFSAGGVAEDLESAVRSASGSGTFRLTVGHGGSLSGELGQGEGASTYVLQSALTDFETDGENPGLVTGQIEGYLLDSASNDLVASYSGAFAIQGNSGRFVAEVHPLEGPDPWKVDIGTLKGYMRVHTARSTEEQAAQLYGGVLLELQLAQEL